LRHAAEALRRDGCARALLTLITRPWDDLLAKVKSLRKILRGDERLNRFFPGWHIEGPFLSDQPGFHGAHNPHWMRDPSADELLRLKEVVGDDPLLITMAPERSGAPEAVRQAVDCGFVVSFGHTNAGAGALRAAVAAGGTAFTHLGNGCPQMLDRHDNIVWRILDEEALVAGLIPDGRHVSPPFFRALHRALGRSRIYWTTDAMAAAGAPEGSYSLGELEVEVGADRVVRNTRNGGFAGSALEPLEGIRCGAAMLGCRWQEVWDFFSVHPARLMNLPGELEPGSPAGFCLLRES
jgi:N-acetylglucosamine-6-phosphate deacetylase